MILMISPARSAYRSLPHPFAFLKEVQACAHPIKASECLSNSIPTGRVYESIWKFYYCAVAIESGHFRSSRCKTVSFRSVKHKLDTIFHPQKSKYTWQKRG